MTRAEMILASNTKDLRRIEIAPWFAPLEHFASKWMPVGRKKMRKNDKLVRTT